MKSIIIIIGLFFLIASNYLLSQDYIFLKNNYSVTGDILQISDSIYYSFEGALNTKDRKVDLADEYDDLYSGGTKSDPEYKSYDKALKKYPDVYFGVNLHDNIYAIEINLVDSIILKSISINGVYLTYSNQKLNAPKEIVELFENSRYSKIKKPYNSIRFGVTTNIVEINDYRLSLIKTRDNKTIKKFCSSDRIAFKDEEMKMNGLLVAHGTISYIDSNQIFIVYQKKDSYIESYYLSDEIVKIGYHSHLKTSLINVFVTIGTIGGGIPFLRDYYTLYNLKNSKYKIEIR
jgi:hypothetical protein